MDASVHGFAAANVYPLPKERSDEPYAANGSAENGWGDGDAFAETHHKHHHKKHHKKHNKDISERGYEAEVHGFTAHNTSPIAEERRSDQPHVANGSDPSSHESLHQHKSKKHHHHRNVGETGMEAEVHGFTAHNTSPIAEERRSAQAHIPNGSDASAQEASLHQSRKHKHHSHHKRDVAERGMDAEVHGFTSSTLPPLNEWERKDTPYDANGSDPSAQDSSLHQSGHKHHHKKHHSHHKKDVAERGMDAEVHGFAAHNTSPVTEMARAK